MVVGVVVDGAHLLDEHVCQRTAALGTEKPRVVDLVTGCLVGDKVEVQVEMNTDQRSVSDTTRVDAFSQLHKMISQKQKKEICKIKKIKIKNKKPNYGSLTVLFNCSYDPTL